MICRTSTNMATQKEQNQNIQIPDIFVHNIDAPPDASEELPEYVPLRHTSDLEQDPHAAALARRQRRSGVVNSMESLPRISTSSEHPEPDSEQNSESETTFMSPGCSNSSTGLSEQDYEDEEVDGSDNKEFEEIDEYDDSVSTSRSKLRDRQPTPPPMYDETRPRRRNKFEPNFDPSNDLRMYYDETKPKRKVSFDTALNPSIQRMKKQARIDGQPVRKISLDAGLDAQNIRRVSFQSNPFENNMGRNASNIESIGQITFDADTGTLKIRKLSKEEVAEVAVEEEEPKESPNTLTPDSQSLPCDTPRKVSYADSDTELGHINRGFQNDTYLDNVTFYVQKNMQNDSELKNGHLFNDQSDEGDIAPTTPTKTKGILKGWKGRNEDSDVGDDRSEKSIGDYESSSLAAHLRKDSIALTSEKLGQILDIQKHYKRLHNKKKRVSTFLYLAQVISQLHSIGHILVSYIDKNKLFPKQMLILSLGHICGTIIMIINKYKFNKVIENR